MGRWCSRVSLASTVLLLALLGSGDGWSANLLSNPGFEAGVVAEELDSAGAVLATHRHVFTDAASM